MELFQVEVKESSLCILYQPDITYGLLIGKRITPLDKIILCSGQCPIEDIAVKHKQIIYPATCGWVHWSWRGDLGSAPISIIGILGIVKKNCGNNPGIVGMECSLPAPHIGTIKRFPYFQTALGTLVENNLRSLGKSRGGEWLALKLYRPEKSFGLDMHRH